MFKYDEFPEIKKAHKQYNRLVNRYLSMGIKYQRTEDENLYNEWGVAIQDALKYRNEGYGKIVFDVFKKIKPDINDSIEGKIRTWDELYGQDFDKLSDTLKKSLSMLIEEERPYRLPDEYYDDRPIY